MLRARPGLTHSRFFLWKCFIGSAPERGTAHRTKKKTRPVRVFFFAPRAARAHSLTLLFGEMFYRLGPREKDSTPNKKKKRPVRVFFFAPRAARAHSLTLLFVEMFYRLGPREKDSTPNKKKKHVQCAFFFLLPARPGLTHSLVPVVEYYKCWKQKTERTRNKKTQKMARIRSKKRNACSTLWVLCWLRAQNFGFQGAKDSYTSSFNSKNLRPCSQTLKSKSPQLLGLPITLNSSIPYNPIRP